MYHTIKTLIVACITLCFFGTASGAHIIGGEITYQCLQVDSSARETTFLVTCTIYRDDAGQGAELGADAEFGLYIGGGVNWLHQRSITVPLKNKGPVDINEENPCIIIPPNLAVEKGVYEFEITLPWTTSSYQLSHQRCCRNNTISNIVNPGETGAAFATEITAEALTSCNNSPEFNKFPPIVICVNQDINFDHSATDAEGDQLLYEFCAPLQAGGTDGSVTPGDPQSCTGVTPDPMRCPPPYDEVQFDIPTYSQVNPMGGNPQIRIDPQTGVISGVPNQVGQYVVGVCVKEFRNGELISTLRRDFQFNVAICEVAVEALLETREGIDVQQGKDFTFKSCGSKTVEFTNQSQDPRYIKSYKWVFDINGDEVVKNTRNVTFDFPTEGTYRGQMILNPDTEECTDTAELTVNVFPRIDADFTFDYDTCIAGPVDFVDQSVSGAGPVVDWSWDFNSEGDAVAEQPSYTFTTPGDKEVTLIVADANECRDTLTKSVSYRPVPSLLIIEPSKFIGCQPASIFFNNLSAPIDSTYKLEWTFGDGNTGGDISPTHLYEDVGIFDVNLKVTSPIGCETEKDFPELIQVKESPVADFSYTPEFPSSFRKTVSFIDNSVDAIAWQWDFGGFSSTLEQNPTFTFPDTGVYNVELIVVHPKGCTDTATQVVDVVPITTLQFPNAFSPNNDGLNDSFKGVGLTEGLDNYQLTIFNRWGQQVFQTTDSVVGWNGEMSNSGALAPQDVYVFVVTYNGPRGEPKEQRGHITLVR